MKSFNNKINIESMLAIVFSVVFIFLISSPVQATSFIDPTADPEGDNNPSPINISSTSQSKQGILRLNSTLDVSGLITAGQGQFNDIMSNDILRVRGREICFQGDECCGGGSIIEEDPWFNGPDSGTPTIDEDWLFSSYPILNNLVCDGEGYNLGFSNSDIGIATWGEHIAGTFVLGTDPTIGASDTVVSLGIRVIGQNVGASIKGRDIGGYYYSNKNTAAKFVSEYDKALAVYGEVELAYDPTKGFYFAFPSVAAELWGASTQHGPRVHYGDFELNPMINLDYIEVPGTGNAYFHRDVFLNDNNEDAVTEAYGYFKVKRYESELYEGFVAERTGSSQSNPSLEVNDNAVFDSLNSPSLGFMVSGDTYVGDNFYSYGELNYNNIVTDNNSFIEAENEIRACYFINPFGIGQMPGPYTFNLTGNLVVGENFHGSIGLNGNETTIAGPVHVNRMKTSRIYMDQVNVAPSQRGNYFMWVNNFGEVKLCNIQTGAGCN